MAEGPVSQASNSNSKGKGIGEKFKILAFSSAYAQAKGGQNEDQSSQPIFCLMEIVLTESLGTASGASGGDSGSGSNGSSSKWTLECDVKCTQKERAAGFIAELSLGNLFHLL